jgi:hypothetical protein
MGWNSFSSRRRYHEWVRVDIKDLIISALKKPLLRSRERYMWSWVPIPTYTDPLLPVVLFQWSKFYDLMNLP